MKPPMDGDERRSFFFIRVYLRSSAVPYISLYSLGALGVLGVLGVLGG
ncbi:hypothetical protein PLANPX_1255 [Lacipirellula parvula]|uniref:Uncharacterized protein n=1 Tax=Lacipirellula parvula TaxID=2650471 RepID=A0A5K7XBF8_9BACT|nr:hypothetical protein PLANPX_1255 [Lacipirellula parvula]